MKRKIKNLFKNAFFQITAVYAILLSIATLNFFSKYSMHFEIFALIIALFGIFIISEQKEEKLSSKRIHYFLIVLGVFLIALFRVMPYINNSVPLGYDTGIYKYAIESFNAKGFGVENWVKEVISPGFLYLMKMLSFLPLQFILIWLFIIFNLALGIAIYFCTKEYFGKNAAIIALLVYSTSIVQFKVFTFMYYKNLIALTLMLFAFAFLKKEKRFLFIIFGALVGAVHLPTFFIFGLSYMLFTAYNYKQWKINLLSGFSMLALVALSYIGFFKEAVFPLIFPVLESFVSPGESPGTFINFSTYQFSTLTYLPFAILGLFFLIKKREFNIIFFLTIIGAIIVYFQFFFFNRFIICLDIALIMLSSLGFCAIIKSKRNLGISILVIMLFLASFSLAVESKNAKPLISQEQLSLIEKLNETEINSSVISLSSNYSPWVLAYSKRRTIAPGLFEEDFWTREQWDVFWQTKDKNETINLISVYSKPIYLFAGSQEFTNPCFIQYLEQNNNKIYKYIC